MQPDSCSTSENTSKLSEGAVSAGGILHFVLNYYNTVFIPLEGLKRIR